MPKAAQDPAGEEHHVHGKHAQEEPDDKNKQPFYELHARITPSWHLTPIRELRFKLSALA